MRSIRRAALAGATAASLVLGVASVATAAPDTSTSPTAVSPTDAPTSNTATDTTTTSSSENGLSSKFKGGSSSNDTSKEPTAKDSDSNKGGSSKIKGLSSQIGKKLEADQPANGARLWGSTKAVQDEPKWARYMQVVTIVGVLGSLLGLVVFPAYNFLVFNHLIPGLAPAK